MAICTDITIIEDRGLGEEECRTHINITFTRMSVRTTATQHACTCDGVQCSAVQCHTTHGGLSLVLRDEVWSQDGITTWLPMSQCQMDPIHFKIFKRVRKSKFKIFSCHEQL